MYKNFLLSIVVGLLVGESSAATTPNALAALRDRVGELLAKPKLAADVRVALEAIREDVEVIARSQQQTKSALPPEYARILENHTAKFEALSIEALSKEEFNVLQDVAGDLRVKANFARRGNATTRLREPREPIYNMAFSSRRRVRGDDQGAAPDA